MWAALLFLVLTIVAGLLGFNLVAGLAFLAAKVLFFVFLVLFSLSLYVGLGSRTVL